MLATQKTFFIYYYIENRCSASFIHSFYFTDPKLLNYNVYCGEVEGSHDKESSINTPEGGFIHKQGE